MGYETSVKTQLKAKNEWVRIKTNESKHFQRTKFMKSKQQGQCVTTGYCSGMLILRLVVLPYNCQCHPINRNCCSIMCMLFGWTQDYT